MGERERERERYSESVKRRERWWDVAFNLQKHAATSSVKHTIPVVSYIKWFVLDSTQESWWCSPTHS